MMYIVQTLGVDFSGFSWHAMMPEPIVCADILLQSLCKTSLVTSPCSLHPIAEAVTTLDTHEELDTAVPFDDHLRVSGGDSH